MSIKTFFGIGVTMTSCPLCEVKNEIVLWRGELLRIILVNNPDYPAFCRVILNRHVREMTDLPNSERSELMHAVFATETALREQLQPEKINLASLGNQVPHLHWHIIPRFSDDNHFPDSVWSPAQRDGVAHAVEVKGLAQEIAQQILKTSSR